MSCTGLCNGQSNINPAALSDGEKDNMSTIMKALKMESCITQSVSGCASGEVSSIVASGKMQACAAADSSVGCNTIAVNCASMLTTMSTITCNAQCAANDVSQSASVNAVNTLTMNGVTIFSSRFRSIQKIDVSCNFLTVFDNDFVANATNSMKAQIVDDISRAVEKEKTGQGGESSSTQISMDTVKKCLETSIESIVSVVQSAVQACAVVVGNNVSMKDVIIHATNEVEFDQTIFIKVIAQTMFKTAIEQIISNSGDLEATTKIVALLSNKNIGVDTTKALLPSNSIVGIVIGGVAVLVILCVVGYFMYKRNITGATNLSKTARKNSSVTLTGATNLSKTARKNSSVTFKP
jgi:hypothetical protein